ncbi:hypothetical protein AAC387_Pa05g3536 [Persea americana]
MKMFLFPQVHASSASVCNLSAWECGVTLSTDQGTILTWPTRRLLCLAAKLLQSKGFQVVKQLSSCIASKRAS